MEQQIEQEYKKLEEEKMLLSRREAAVRKKELEAENAFPDLFKKRFQEFDNQCNARLQQCNEWERSFAQRESIIAERELKLTQRESELEIGILQQRSKKLHELETEIVRQRTERLNELERELADVRRQRLHAIEQDVQQSYDELARQQEIAGEQETVVRKRELALDEQKQDLDFEKRRLENEKQRLQQMEQEINAEVNRRTEVRYASFVEEANGYNEELQRLRNSIQSSRKLMHLYEDMKNELGSNPHEALENLARLKVELEQAHEELARRPSMDLAQRYREVDAELNKFRQKEQDLHERMTEFERIIQENVRMHQEISLLKTEKTRLQEHNNFLENEQQRLTAAYKTEEGRESRIEAIETPLIKNTLSLMSQEALPESEMNWLSSMTESFKQFGFEFPQRLLYSFHTALKVAEISPLTVLAGVSGTGKSELPRLYSHFGGINFMSLPVQPNWDSQEAMLGYFNSIDNRFDAQDVLRFLAQTQREPDDGHGLNHALNMILLDEMNLANVELYFSDFLSKLEQRRGLLDRNTPSLGIKIGTGLEDYQIKLGRNVLWVGTMNQDETTRTLSDKVIDRGIILNFPSPDTLKRREKTLKLGGNSPLLPVDTWNIWCKSDSDFSVEQIGEYKSTVEHINKELGKTGRALGHRVWQSVEAYMLNHPQVIEAQVLNDESALKKALKNSFEDQLVQKIMPKLRGIETRGNQGDSLKKIQQLLSDKKYNLDEDFENAREFGYGQFMWCTSRYLLS
ncbi:McrB family protein [Spirochaeta dissipatitropha]